MDEGDLSIAVDRFDSDGATRKKDCNPVLSECETASHGPEKVRAPLTEGIFTLIHLNVDQHRERIFGMWRKVNEIQKQHCKILEFEKAVN